MSITKDDLKAGFTAAFGEQEGINYYFCPGRICLIGEHLDYNGGHVLPVAISLGIYAAVVKNNGNIIRCVSHGFKNEVVIKLADEILKKDNDPWGNYVRGVVKHLQDDGVKIPGLDIYFYADLPHGAGLSSSAAIEVLTAFLVQTEAGAEVDPEKTSLLCKEVENEFVGMKCGIMDQFAVTLSRPGEAILLNCETVELSYVPVDTWEYQFVIINSNTPRALTGSAFNTRRQECEAALEELEKKYGVMSLAAGTVDQANTIHNENARKRALHVITENQRVLEAKEALTKGNLSYFGDLMKLSHTSLKELYEVTGPELDTIAESAWKLKGCLGARMTGAGFGGCCIALVKSENVESFKNSLNKIYQQKFSKPLDFYVFKVSGGVHPL